MNANKLINVKLVTEAQLVKAISSPYFVDAEACGYEDQSLVWELHTRKQRILHKNLLTLGFQILQTVQ